MPKSKNNTHKHPPKKREPEESRSNIKTGYRIGALFLVVVLIVGLVAMYAF